MTVDLVTGDDEALVAALAHDLVHAAVGRGDRTLMVDDLDGEYEARALVDAAQTPPLLTDKRVVVGRGIGRFSTDELAPLIAYLRQPLATTDLVLVAGGGRVPKQLGDAVKAGGGQVVSANAPVSKRDRAGWIEERIASSGLRLDGAATQALAQWMGEDAGRLQSVLDTLVSAHGTARRLGVADVGPYLGAAGGVPPWDLTDAIDRGDTTEALSLLGRMTGPGGRHPLQVMAILHGQYVKLMRLDGPQVDSEAQVAALLGIKPGYPARKALEQYRRLGGAGVVKAMHLLAQADLDLRGAKDWPDELVMEVLVARLSRLGTRPARAARP